MGIGVGSYVSKFIGLPWQRDGLHCWALVSKVQTDLFGRAVPAGPLVGSSSALELVKIFRSGLDGAADWTEVPTPQHGAIALMHRGGASPAALIHCGCYLAVDGGGVLHTDEPHGVVFDNLLELRARNWAARWFVPKV